RGRQRLPGPDREPPRTHECPDPLLALGPDLDVVVDGRQLAVEREPPALVSLEQLEHLVDDVDERHAEGLERPVPLPVPVGVRDEDELGQTVRFSPSPPAVPARSRAAAQRTRRAGGTSTGTTPSSTGGIPVRRSTASTGCARAAAVGSARRRGRS